MHSINVKSTKQEVYDAYQELLKENQQLNKQIELLQKEKLAIEVKSQKLPLPINFEGGLQPQKTPVPVTSSINEVMETLSQIKINFSSAVSELSGKLTQKSNELFNLQKEIMNIKDHIDQLYGLGEVKDETLGYLLDGYLDDVKNFEESFSQKESSLNIKLENTKKEWDREKTDHKEKISERNEDLIRLRKREKEEYNYNLSQTRLEIKYKYEQEKKELEGLLASVKSQKEKEWAGIEKEISEKENEYLQAATAASGLEEKKINAIDYAVSEVKNALLKEASFKENLLAKEIEGRKRYNETKISALQKNIALQEAKVTAINKQLSDVLKEAKELASKAIDGASSAKSFEALLEITSESKNNIKKGG